MFWLCSFIRRTIAESDGSYPESFQGTAPLYAFILKSCLPALRSAPVIKAGKLFHLSLSELRLAVLCPVSWNAGGYLYGLRHVRRFAPSRTARFLRSLLHFELFGGSGWASSPLHCGELYAFRLLQRVLRAEIVHSKTEAKFIDRVSGISLNVWKNKQGYGIMEQDCGNFVVDTMAFIRKFAGG